MIPTKLAPWVTRKPAKVAGILRKMLVSAWLLEKGLVQTGNTIVGSLEEKVCSVRD
jgi:hypothetical protein